jgi:asparagine synthetase B (glutamine-hydrolysing)
MILNIDRKYGIMLSGGLDSAVLLYLILKENKNINIQPFSIPKHDGSHMFVSRILEYFNSQFDIKIPETILIGNPDLHHSQQSTVAIKQIFIEYPELDFIYFATNKIPHMILTTINIPKAVTLTG